MHSSRMRTVRSSDCIGGVCSGGVLLPGSVCSGWVSALGGVSAPRGCLLLGGVCSQGGSAPGGCLLRGVSALGGCLLPGGVCSQGCLFLGVSALGGVCSRGEWYPSMHWGRHPHHPCGQTDACKNLTFATSLRTVKITSVIGGVICWLYDIETLQWYQMTEQRYNDQQYNLKSNQKAISAKAHSHAWLEVSQRSSPVSPQCHVLFLRRILSSKVIMNKKNLKQFRNKKHSVFFSFLTLYWQTLLPMQSQCWNIFQRDARSGSIKNYCSRIRSAEILPIPA